MARRRRRFPWTPTVAAEHNVRKSIANDPFKHASNDLKGATKEVEEATGRIRLVMSIIGRKDEEKLMGDALT